VILLALGLLSAFALPRVMLVALLGLVGFLGTPVLIALGVRIAGKAPTLGSAPTVSAFNLGTESDSWIAGLTLDSPFQAAGPAMAGAAMAALGPRPHDHHRAHPGAPQRARPRLGHQLRDRRTAAPQRHTGIFPFIS
jgi:DHA1 family inner membrane transport protein